jgi:aldehyde:ferredoxin oxidoreductase
MIGKRLRISLSDKSWIQDEIPPDWVLKYAGGTGFALKAFRERQESTGESRIVVAPGLMVGTNAPASHWTSIAFYDPAREKVVVSYFGGHWGCGLRLFGAGIMEIEGQAPSSVVLVLEKGQVHFLDGRDLKGLNPLDVCRRLGEVLGHGYSIASIGLAGETGIPISSLLFDGTYQRQSGGLGAVLGRMGLKALAVKGNGRIIPANPQRFYSEARNLRKCFRQENFPYRELSSFGSAWFIRELYQLAMLPIKNYTANSFPDWETLSGESLADAFRRQPVACSGCPIGCRWTTPMGNSWHVGLEIEEIIALGPLCGIANPKEILGIKVHCDRLGIDPVSLGGLIASVMEFGAGKEGQSVKFGDGEKVLKILQEEQSPGTALVRLGILSDVATKTLVHNPAWLGFMSTDPRADSYLALNRMTWPLEEPHLLSSGAFLKRLPLFADQSEEMNVARAVETYQDFYIGLQSLGFCPWTALVLTPRGLDPLLRAALGDGLPDEASSGFGRAIYRDEMIRLSELPPVGQFRKLVQEPIREGPRMGQELNLNRPWRDYLALRGYAEFESAPKGTVV